jgi:hypothetical protein
MQKPDISSQNGMISMEKGMKSWTYKRVTANAKKTVQYDNDREKTNI